LPHKVKYRIAVRGGLSSFRWRAEFDFCTV
jgi:hypothetical protein